MTHTAHPYGFRLGITKPWRSTWFAKDPKKYRALVREDFLIRSFLEKEFVGKMVSSVHLSRERDTLLITIRAARPGLIIGRDGTGVDQLVQRIKKFSKKHGLHDAVTVRIEEVKYTEQSAALVAESIVDALKKRVPHRRLLKQAAEKVMASREVEGVRVMVAGRLGGAEIARTEEAKLGAVPLQTLRADIDYAHRNAVLPYGTIGVKAWVYRGMITE